MYFFKVPTVAWSKALLTNKARFYLHLCLIFMLWLTVSCNVCSVVQHPAPPSCVNYVIFRSTPPCAHGLAALWWCLAGCCQVWASRQGTGPAGFSSTSVGLALAQKRTKKKTTVGTRCTTHLLLPISHSLTSDTELSQYFCHFWHSGKISLSIWNVLCADKCTDVIKYVILQSDVSREVLLAANKSFCATCCRFPDYAPVKRKNSTFP